MTQFRRFNLETLEDLRSELDALGEHLPISADLSVLGEKVSLGNRILPNRMMVQPMEGVDGVPESGSPSDLTFRRYRRFAEGGAGFLWGESIAVVPEGCSNSKQLRLHSGNLDEYKRLVEETREAARRLYGHEITFVIQLTHSGRFSRPGGTPAPMKAQHNPWLDEPLGMSGLEPVSDDYLDSLQDAFVSNAKMAAEAGFDGVDMKSVHGYLIAELLGAHRREGRYGGSYENRTRFLRETALKIRDALPPSCFLTTRLTTLEPTPYPYGWGVEPVESGRADGWIHCLDEPKRLAAECLEMGMPTVNFSMGFPRSQPYLGRPHDNSLVGLPTPPEYPLAGVVRFQKMVRDMSAVCPGTPVPTAALSWLRHLMPQVAAGMVSENWCSLVGLGRLSFAYPDFARDLLVRGELDKSKCCTTCSMCSQIMKDGVGRTGCVIRDKAVYGPELKKGRPAAASRG